MPNLSFADWLLAALAGLILVLLIWVILLTVSVRRQARARQWVTAALRGNKEDLMHVVGKSLADIDRLFSGQDSLQAAGARHRAILTDAIRHVGFVRYDAFDEVGGQLSFSAALLNEKGDGLVITSINGRSDCRVYAKPIVGKESTYSLSQEEETAIAEALKGARV